MRNGPALALVAMLGIHSAAARETISNVETERRWAFGWQIAPLDLPRGHLGIPFGLTEDSFHLGTALVLRYQSRDDWALNVGFGNPTSAMGLGLWLGHEVFRVLSIDSHRNIELAIYEDASMQIGFAGPDYYARKTNTFVGYEYAYGGPLAFALRLPLGLRVTWLQGIFDTYVESVGILALTPSVEDMFELAVGVRFHF